MMVRGQKPLPPPCVSGLIPVALGEVRRLLAYLITNLPAAPPSGPGSAGAYATSTAPEPATTSEAGQLQRSAVVLVSWRVFR